MEKNKIQGKTRVMVVSTVGLIYDGITSVILAYLEAMDLTELDIYVAATIKVEPSIRRKLEALGCHIVELPSRREAPAKYLLSLSRFLRKERIDVLHAHGNSGTLAIEMMAGFLGGCKKRMAHSHNTRCDQVKADRLLRPLFNLLYTDALACGEAAGQWLFGRRPFTVLTNGRNVDRFAYDPAVRDAMQKEYGITDELVIGHVGGFFEQKNHRFLLEIYRAILKKEPSARLFLIGDGPLRQEMEASAEDIRANVVFTGTTDRVPDYLQLMDGMLLPSLFEGLPLVAVEWQINGLPCVFADTITKDCAMTDTVAFLSLEDTPECWADRIIAMVRENHREESAAAAKNRVREAGFDIKSNAKVLTAAYLS